MDQRSRGPLAGRVALVTGASGSLGRAICATFRAEGATVLGVDLRDDGGCDFAADISTSEGTRRMVDEAVARHGQLDILVLNAGVQFVSAIADFPEVEWDQLMDVMVKGPYLAMKAAWPALTSRPASRILVTASVSGLVAEPYKCAYVAAKHAVIGLTKVAALEGASMGLTANAVAPGWMSTSMLERQIPAQMALRGVTRDEVLDGMLARQPVKQLIDPVQVATVLAMLAGERASAITGVCIPVDHGTLAS